VEHPRLIVHPTRRISQEDPISRTITFDESQSVRFSRPAPRPIREDERLYISGAFTLGELERIIAWARGPQQ
jgi:hypothetical protein